MGNNSGTTLSSMPNDGSTFYWRVKAGNTAGWSSYSGAWSFINGTVIQNPPSITVGLLRIKSDQITGNGQNYTVSGNISIGYINNSDYLIENLNATIKCNIGTNSITLISGGESFNISGNTGWNWNFIESGSWSFDVLNGVISYNSAIDLRIINNNLTLYSSSYNLDLINRRLTGSTKFLGNKYLENLGQFDVAIDLNSISFSMNFKIGVQLTLGDLQLGILPNTAGITFNLKDEMIDINADFNLLTLKLIDLDGAGFEFMPHSNSGPISGSIGLNWDFKNGKILFTGDTGLDFDLTELLGKIFLDKLLN